jgi:4-hydroxy-3-methylbut-2-enyl diphosphate reductase
LIDRDGLVVVAATSVEASAARRELPLVRVCETGVALAKMREGFGDAVISCGLAGGLRAEIPSGTILVPDEVRRPDGSVLRCDPDMVKALREAARSLGFEPLADPLVTSESLVRGSERAAWAQRGYAAVDMETGLLRAPRVAAVRVVLDTPIRELSGEWLNPIRAMIKPRNWPEMFWLARDAPRYARLAARVIRYALSG